MANTTIIIPTTGVLERRDSLERAIASINTQTTGSAVPLVLLNGDRFDHELKQLLSERRDIRFYYIAEGGLPNALRVGRNLVDTAFFGFLDDDDLYLPHALETRIAPFVDDTSTDVVITNGLHQDAGGSRNRCIVRLPSKSDDLFMHCIRVQNWLASCGGLYRTDRVEPSCFESLAKYFEWTDVAFRIAQTKKLVFLEEMTFVVCDSPGSLWKSGDVTFRRIEFLKKLIAGCSRADVRVVLSEKLLHACHEYSAQCLLEKNLADAWKYHVQSLGGLVGLRYLPYSRRIFFKALRSFHERQTNA